MCRFIDIVWSEYYGKRQGFLYRAAEASIVAPTWWHCTWGLRGYLLVGRYARAELRMRLKSGPMLLVDSWGSWLYLQPSGR